MNPSFLEDHLNDFYFFFIWILYLGFNFTIINFAFSFLYSANTVDLLEDRLPQNLFPVIWIDFLFYIAILLLFNFVTANIFQLSIKNLKHLRLQSLYFFIGFSTFLSAIPILYIFFFLLGMLLHPVFISH